MDQVRRIVEEANWDRSSLKIEGERALRFSRTRSTIGAPADEYEPYCRRLAIRHPLSLLELAPGSPEFEELEKAIQLFKLPLYATLVEQGAPAPGGMGEFSLSYELVDDLRLLDDEWLEALMSDDEDRINDVHWRRFQYSNSFQQHPCTRETFEMVREASDSGLGGTHLRMLPLADYYDWYARSSRFIVALHRCGRRSHTGSVGAGGQNDFGLARASFPDGYSTHQVLAVAQYGDPSASHGSVRGHDR